MSYYGAHWKINGLTAGLIIMRQRNGRYAVVFEREYASIEQIETLDWSHPMIEHLVEKSEYGLPEGYGFDVIGITYDHHLKAYTVELKTAKQYLGDVTGYQLQIEEKDALIAEKNILIEAHEQQIEETAEDLETAYQTGVESVG